MNRTFDKFPIAFDQTRAFDSLPVDYVSGNQGLKSFYNFFPSPEGFKAEITRNKRGDVDRIKLVETLK